MRVELYQEWNIFAKQPRSYFPLARVIAALPDPVRSGLSKASGAVVLSRGFLGAVVRFRKRNGRWSRTVWGCWRWMVWGCWRWMVCGCWSRTAFGSCPQHRALLCRAPQPALPERGGQRWGWSPGARGATVRVAGGARRAGRAEGRCGDAAGGQGRSGSGAGTAAMRRWGRRPGFAMGAPPPNGSLGLSAGTPRPNGAPGPGDRGCENGALMDRFGIFLQGLLGVVAFSTLMREWQGRGLRPGGERAGGSGSVAGPRPRCPEAVPGRAGLCRAPGRAGLGRAAAGSGGAASGGALWVPGELERGPAGRPQRRWLKSFGGHKLAFLALVAVLVEFIGWVCVLPGIVPAGGGGVCGAARVWDVHKSRVWLSRFTAGAPTLSCHQQQSHTCFDRASLPWRAIPGSWSSVAAGRAQLMGSTRHCSLIVVERQERSLVAPALWWGSHNNVEQFWWVCLYLVV